MTTRAIGIGAGGNCRPIIDAIRLAGGVELVGLLDEAPSRHGEMVDGIPILGGDDLLAAMKAEGVGHFFVGIGSSGREPFSCKARRDAFLRCSGVLEPLTVVHPGATVSPAAQIGPGACVLAGAIINAGARVGANTLINTGAIIEHDCRVGAHAHVATGAILAGAVTVATLAHVGAGATIRQGLAIGEGSVIGIGAVVVADVDPGTVVAGVPARPLVKG
ncbi:MAG: acetyltransferase [Pseudomonadota bacterium]